MAIDMCVFAHYVPIPDGDCQACTVHQVHQIAFNVFADVGCAWTRESMAGALKLSALSAWDAMENPWILPRNSKDYLSYQWTLDPEALAEALGSIKPSSHGVAFGKDSDSECSSPCRYPRYPSF